MNKSYVKGRRFEYQVKNKLEKVMNIVGRSASSHSEVDIFGINTSSNKVVFVQCKLGKKPELIFIKDMQVYFIQVGSIEELDDFINKFLI